MCFLCVPSEIAVRYRRVVFCTDSFYVSSASHRSSLTQALELLDGVSAKAEPTTPKQDNPTNSLPAAPNKDSSYRSHPLPGSDDPFILLGQLYAYMKAHLPPQSTLPKDSLFYGLDVALFLRDH